MPIKNKWHFLKIFIGTFSILSIIFFLGSIFINTLFYYFPSVFLIFSDTYKTEIRYNEIRTSLWSWSIEALEEQMIPWRESDQTELLGDALYAQDGQKNAIINYYERSLALRENDRVKMKLTELYTSSWESASWSWADEIKQTIDSLNQTWSLPEIENAKIRMKESEENRWKYIRKSLDNYIIKDSQDFLEFWIERKDW